MTTSISYSSNLKIGYSDSTIYPDNTNTGFKVGSSDLSNYFDIDLNRTNYSGYFKKSGYNSMGVFTKYYSGTPGSAMSDIKTLSGVDSYKYSNNSYDLYGLKRGCVYRRCITGTQKTPGQDASLSFTSEGLKGSGGMIYLAAYSGGGSGGAGYRSSTDHYGPGNKNNNYQPILLYSTWSMTGGGGGASGLFAQGPVEIISGHRYTFMLASNGTIYLYDNSAGTYSFHLGPGSSASGSTGGAASSGYYNSKGGDGGTNGDGSGGDNNTFRTSLLNSTIYIDPSHSNTGDVSYRTRVGWIESNYTSYYANTIDFTGGLGGNGRVQGTYGIESLGGGGGGGASLLSKGLKGSNGGSPGQYDSYRPSYGGGGSGGGCHYNGTVGNGSAGGAPYFFLYY